MNGFLVHIIDSEIGSIKRFELFLDWLAFFWDHKKFITLLDRLLRHGYISNDLHNNLKNHRKMISTPSKIRIKELYDNSACFKAVINYLHKRAANENEIFQKKVN